MAELAPLGQKLWAMIEEAIFADLADIDKFVEKALLADSGIPPLHEERSPREQYEQLLALRNANSQLYWGDPEAVKALQRLSHQFGPTAPASAIPPYPTQMMPYPSESELVV